MRRLTTLAIALFLVMWVLALLLVPLSAALALTFGPTFLYYSRFAREDIYFAAITLALIAVTARFLDRPRRHQPALIGALLALSFATKETTFITVFVAGTKRWPASPACGSWRRAGSPWPRSPPGRSACPWRMPPCWWR